MNSLYAPRQLLSTFIFGAGFRPATFTYDKNGVILYLGYYYIPKDVINQ